MYLPKPFKPTPSPYGTLRGHVTRANPIWRECQSGSESASRMAGLVKGALDNR